SLLVDHHIRETPLGLLLLFHRFRKHPDFQFGPPLEIKLYRSIRFFSDYQPHLTSQPANWFLSFRTIEIMAVDALSLVAVTEQVPPRLQAINSGLVLAKPLHSILLKDRATSQ